ncbi:sensor histidine kinase [Nonomuraea angiospora]|uniref:histidine kinase n=1 Tax=Nonomuraea angiospora TaxID=46172 RepID=A0ABR9LTB8_9ACTN|nr:histidine kinase [Nonomuraea angiospora]MBE1583911.1 signal transduction histidine kinase [Nonomuraea angiospora]
MRQRTFLAARIDQWSREHPRRLDLTLTGLMWLVLGLTSALAGLPAFLVATAAILPLVVRRRFPTAVLLWSAAAFGVQLLVVPIPLPADIAQAVVVYTVAAHVGSLPIRLLALGAALAGSVLAGFRWSTPPEYPVNVVKNAAFLGILAVLVWVIGNLVRGRQANMRALREAGAQLEEGRLHHERFVAQRQRVAAAREIHDIVAHSLTVVIVQADGAEYAAEHAQPWDRGDAGRVFATIGRTARSALTEVRGVIEVLREADGPDEPRGAGLGLAELRQLVDSVRAAGLAVEVDAEQAAFDDVPTAIRFAVLRVARESLTNVLKHAGPYAAAHVVVARTQGGIMVRVEDDGVGVRRADATGSEPGYGLDGMRERLRALGGVLEAGPRPGGGFVVDAAIPVAVLPPSAPGGTRASGER